MNDAIMTNKRVLKAAGVTDAEITAIETGDAAIYALDNIHKKLMAFVYEQRIEWANANNPLAPLERTYADLNGGEENGFFSETLIPMRDAGANGLYGGTPYVPGKPYNPWEDEYYGETPLQYTFGINTEIDRHVKWTEKDWLMYFRKYSLIDYALSGVQILSQEDIAMRYAIEKNVLGCEIFQDKPYAQQTVFSDAADLDQHMFDVYDSARYNATNTKYKKVKFSTTRRTRDLVYILKSSFWRKFAQRFQFGSYLKPFINSDENGNMNVNGVNARVILVDDLPATTLSANAILDPKNMAAATLPANSEMVGRIVDMNAIKFGIGARDAKNIPLDARNTQYDLICSYIFDMCDAYINTPILVSTTFNADRILQVKDQNSVPPASSSKA